MSDDSSRSQHQLSVITEVLRREHAAISQLIDELPNAGTPEQKQYLMDEIEARFTTHSELEDELIRTALASPDPHVVQLARTALEADRETTGALREISDMYPWARTYDSEVERVVERLRDHFELEERKVFPVIGRRIPAREIRQRA